MEHIRCLIIGSGPAGYTAAIYTARANLNPVIIEGHQPGGQLTTTTEVENFPGYPEGITGPQLMDDLRDQAVRFGTDIRRGLVTSVDFSSKPLRVTVDNKTELTADAVIICTGASARYLGLPDEQKYAGMGVSACATCDGFFYRGRTVAVVGGGDTACEEALYLSGLASKVMQSRVVGKDNIEILFNTNTEGLFGEEFVEGAHLVEHVGTDRERHFDIAIDGFFLAIGHQPNTRVFQGHIELDEQGFIVTGPGSTATSRPGVFAAGDVADPVYQQAISAAGMGCRAAIDVDRYLMTE